MPTLPGGRIHVCCCESLPLVSASARAVLDVDGPSPLLGAGCPAEICPGIPGLVRFLRGWCRFHLMSCVGCRRGLWGLCSRGSGRVGIQTLFVTFTVVGFRLHFAAGALRHGVSLVVWGCASPAEATTGVLM